MLMWMELVPDKRVTRDERDVIRVPDEAVQTTGEGPRGRDELENAATTRIRDDVSRRVPPVIHDRGGRGQRARRQQRNGNREMAERSDVVRVDRIRDAQRDSSTPESPSASPEDWSRGTETLTRRGDRRRSGAAARAARRLDLRLSPAARVLSINGVRVRLAPDVANAIMFLKGLFS